MILKIIFGALKLFISLIINADSVANADANYIVNVDAAAKGKDKNDRRVFRRDANGRIFELRGVNNDAPDELY